MKLHLLLFCLTISVLGLTAFGVISLKDTDTPLKTVKVPNELRTNLPANEPLGYANFTDFIYEIGPRFGPIKKSKLQQARTIADFLSPDEIASIVVLKSVNVVLFENEKQTDNLELGINPTLNEAQLQLLRSFDYSTSFVIRADFQKENQTTGMLENDYRSPHLTVVPERQAEYSYGKEALMAYLRENSKAIRADIDPKDLKAAKLSFLVTKEGVVEIIGIDRSSGYPEVDLKVIELISNAPGLWKPAQNAQGQKVGQQLVVSFGLMGC